jgi:predicted small lipoprotein YifL
LHFFQVAIRSPYSVPVRLLVAGLAALALNSCGLKDDLYLPDNPPAGQELTVTDVSVEVTTEVTTEVATEVATEEEAAPVQDDGSADPEKDSP